MKIIHCCFGNEHYIDTWGYQQNLLPLYHAKLGHETVVLASNDTYPRFVNEDVVVEIKERGDSYFNGPVRVERRPSYFAKHIHFQITKNLYSILENEKPDIIFFHGGINLSLIPCVKYKKSHLSTFLCVDSHADSMNVNKRYLYRALYFKVFWTIIHKYCQKYVDTYYGVTIGRCNFLKEYFHIKPPKIHLLPIGADVDAANEIQDNVSQLRDKYGFSESEIVIVHGGKLDKRKGTTELISAYKKLRKTHFPNLRLVVFGKLVDENISHIVDSDVRVYDWLSRTQTFELFKLADLAVWPVHHTTLIEDCVAAGLPYLIRKTETTQHLINSSFYLNKGNEEELLFMISTFIDNGGKNAYAERVELIKDRINYYSVADSVVKCHGAYL